MKMRQMLRSELFARSQFYCEYCRVDLLSHQRHFESMVLDHLRPRSLGGPDGTENRRGVCAACDRIKRDAPTESTDVARELLARFRIGLGPWFERFRATYRIVEPTTLSIEAPKQAKAG